MASYIGLYYPFIHFKDESWLKLTALYWDKMGRIVPQGYRPEDSDTVKQLREESGFIVDFRLTLEAIELGDKFGELLRQRTSELQHRYGVSQRGNWPHLGPAEAPPQAGGPSGMDPRLSYVFYDKLSPELQNALIDSDLALLDPGSDQRWVGMHPKLALIYKTALAEEMAAARQLYPLTDETFDHLAVTGCTLERLAQALLGDVRLADHAPAADEVEAQMAMVALQSVMPRDMASVPTQKIVTLRERYAVERAVFQEHLHEMLATMGELRKIGDHEAVKAHLTVEYERELRPQIDEFRNRLHALAIDTVTGVMNVRVRLPELITSAAVLAGLGPLNPVLAAGGAVAFSVLPVIRDKRKEARDVARSTPAAYLLHLEEGLKPATIMSWIASRARQFFFGV